METNVKVANPYAGFWIRFVAYAIDLILIELFFIILLSGISFVLGIIGDKELAMSLPALLKNNWLINYGLAFLVILAYFSIMESSNLKASAGKLCFGLIVVNSETGDKISVLKSLGRTGIKSLLGILLPSVAFNEKKMGFHDEALGTLVIRKKDLGLVKGLIQREQEEIKRVQREKQAENLKAYPEIYKKIKEEPERWDEYYQPTSRNDVDDETYSKERKAYWAIRLG